MDTLYSGGAFIALQTRCVSISCSHTSICIRTITSKAHAHRNTLTARRGMVPIMEAENAAPRRFGVGALGVGSLALGVWSFFMGVAG